MRDYERCDRLAMLLGSMDVRLYQGLLSAAVLAVSILMYSLAAVPIWTRICETEEFSERLREYATRKEDLLAQLNSHESKRGMRLAAADKGETSSPRSLILEGVHSQALRAGVVITDFRNSPAVATGATGSQIGIRFSAQGTFMQTSEFVRLLSNHEDGLIISDMVIENIKWPDFAGDLRLSIGGITRPEE